MEEILGMDRMQYQQISMIAQGEFLKLLYAKGKERSEIFRKIFGTWYLYEFQEKIKRRHLSCKYEYENLGNTLLEQEDNIFVSKDAEENEEYTRYLKQNQQIVEFMDVVNRYQYRKQQEYENFQKQKETQEELYQKQRIVFSQITEKRQKIKDIKEEIKELIVQEKENKAEQRAIKKEYDHIQKELPKLHKNELRFQELQKQIKQYKELEALEKKKESLKNAKERMIRQQEEKEAVEVGLSYLMGLLAHYTLDTSLHPYVYARTGYDPADPYAPKATMGIHFRLEAAIDANLIAQKLGIMPNAFYPEKTMHAEKKEKNSVAEMIAQSISCCYHLNLKKEAVMDSMFMMQHIVPQFFDRTGRRKKYLSKFEFPIWEDGLFSNLYV